jgi:hypothetical protein
VNGFFAMSGAGGIATTPEVITQRIRDRLDAGALVRMGPMKMWGGLGKRDACDACGEPILTNEVEYEFVVEKGVSYRFHIKCAALWQAELTRRGVA